VPLEAFLFGSVGLRRVRCADLRGIGRDRRETALAWGDDRVPNPIRRLVERLRDGIRYVLFRRARARALRKAKGDDPNIYPLW
jgi:hypothetical protein